MLNKGVELKSRVLFVAFSLCLAIATALFAFDTAWAAGGSPNVIEDGYESLPSPSIAIDIDEFIDGGQLEASDPNWGMSKSGFVRYMSAFDGDSEYDLPGFSVLYPSAAYDKAGNRYDIRIALSNIHMKTQSAIINPRFFESPTSLRAPSSSDHGYLLECLPVVAGAVSFDPETGEQIGAWNKKAVARARVEVTFLNSSTQTEANGSYTFFIGNLNTPDSLQMENGNDRVGGTGGPYAESFSYVSGALTDIHVLEDNILGWNGLRFYQDFGKQFDLGDTMETSLAFLADASSTVFDYASSGFRTALFMEGANYKIVATAGQGGSISPDGTTYAERGWDYNFEAKPNPGYVVQGLTVDGNAVSSADGTYTFKNVQDDHTIHVEFKPIAYKVKFVPNVANATGAMVDQGMVFDEPADLFRNQFKSTGRTFVGWNTKADGSGVDYSDMQEVVNLTTEANGVVTLYAQWDIQYGRIVLNKIDADSKKGAQGNGNLAGAKFGVYRDAACKDLLTTISIGADGIGRSGNTLPIPGNPYYVKEVEAPSGYTLSPNVYEVNAVMGD